MSTVTTLPLIGQTWPGQGGTFEGIQLSADGTQLVALILSPEISDKPLIWKQANEWAKALRTDGHTDFSLPERFEGALLYANSRDRIQLGHWYWLATQSSANYAWCQTFDNGYQYLNGKLSKFKVRAVRRLPLNPLILTQTGAAA